MRLLKPLLAGAALLTLAAPALASAQSFHNDSGSDDQRDRGGYQQRQGYDNRDHGDGGYRQRDYAHRGDAYRGGDYRTYGYDYGYADYGYGFRHHHHHHYWSNYRGW